VSAQGAPGGRSPASAPSAGRRPPPACPCPARCLPLAGRRAPRRASRRAGAQEKGVSAGRCPESHSSGTHRQRHERLVRRRLDALGGGERGQRGQQREGDEELAAAVGLGGGAGGRWRAARASAPDWRPQGAHGGEEVLGSRTTELFTSLFEVNLYSDARTPVGASPRCRVRGEDVGLLWRAPGFRNRARPLGRGSPGGGAGRHGAPSPSSSPPQPLHALLHQQHHARTVLDTRSQPAARLTATRARPGLTRWATVLRRGSGRARPNSQPSTRSRAHRLGGCVRARPTGGDSAAGRHTGAVWDSRWAPAALLEASARFRARF